MMRHQEMIISWMSQWLFLDEGSTGGGNNKTHQRESFYVSFNTYFFVVTLYLGIASLRFLFYFCLWFLCYICHFIFGIASRVCLFFIFKIASLACLLFNIFWSDQCREVQTFLKKQTYHRHTQWIPQISYSRNLQLFPVLFCGSSSRQLYLVRCSPKTGAKCKHQ